MKQTLLFGAISALTGILLGAFGAHALKNVLQPEYLSIYQTGITYQMWHALGLLLLALLQQQDPLSKLLKWSVYLMMMGIILFSGSLYLLVGLDQRWLGMITPLGGVSFIAAWGLLATYAIKLES